MDQASSRGCHARSRYRGCDTAKAKILHLQEFIHAVVRTFPSKARLFDAAKWRDFRGNQSSVDSNYSALKSFGYPPDFFQRRDCKSN
jgi:hypothetical protein